MARRLVLLGFFLLLMAAAGAAAFGVSRDAPKEYCFYFSNQMLMPPFLPGTAAAIHIGNTNSCIAGYGNVTILDQLPETYQFCIPSWVAFTGDGTLCGQPAVDHAAVSPATAISGFKRLIGLRPDHPFVKREAEIAPYKLGKTAAGSCSIHVEDYNNGNGTTSMEDFPPEAVAGMLTAELKRTAEAHLGHRLDFAVVTVPGHFNHFERQDVKYGYTQYGGFSYVSVVDEPVAAAAAYGLHKTEIGDGKVILVFHLGGRTADATKFVIRDGTPSLLARHRDAYLGGDDFTARIVDHMADLIRDKHGGGGWDVRRLTAECERAKKELSYQQETVIRFDSDDGGVSLLSETLTRAKLEELIGDLVARAVGLVESCEGGDGDVDEILLVGGNTRIPMVRELVKDYFHGREASSSKEEEGLEPDEAVIRGALLLSHPKQARYLEDCYDYWYPRRPAHDAA